MRRIFLLSHPIHSASAGILFGLALLIGACSARRDEGNAPEPVVPALDTLFVIGADDGPEDEIIDAVAFRGRPILDQGPDGLIWVVNPAGSNLLVFDAEGEKTAVYGRMGSGPGEFFDVAALSAIQDGAWTWDWRNQQLCRWSARNGLVRTWRTELGQPNSNKAVLEADGTIWFFDQDFAGISDHSVTHNLLRVPAGSDPDTLWQCEIPAAVTPAHMGIAPSYSPHFIHAPGEGVIVCGTYEYVLHHITEAEFTTWSLPTTNTPYSARALRPGGRGGVSESGSNKIYEPPLMPLLGANTGQGH